MLHRAVRFELKALVISYKVIRGINIFLIRFENLNFPPKNIFTFLQIWLQTLANIFFIFFIFNVKLFF